MKVIRRGVFETNSSSSHSVSIKNENISESYLRVDPFDNLVHVQPGEYGWSYDTLKTQTDRLSYLCTMLLCTEGAKVNSVDEITELDGYKEINKIIAEKCNCEGIIIDGDMEIKSYTYGEKTHTYLDFDGYIDHQSCEGYSNINAFLNDYNLDIVNFIFNDGVKVIIDNDNH